MNTKAIRQLADVTLDKYRSSIPRKAFEEFVKDIIAGENRATAFDTRRAPSAGPRSRPRWTRTTPAAPWRSRSTG